MKKVIVAALTAAGIAMGTPVAKGMVSVQEDAGDEYEVEEVAELPNQEFSLTEMAEFSNILEFFDLALNYSEAAIRENPKDANAYLQAAIALNNLGRNSEALEMAGKALKYAGKDKELKGRAYSEEYDSYVALGDADKALKSISKAIKEQKGDASYLMMRARILYPDDPKKAQKDIDEAIRLDPDNHSIYLDASLMKGDKGEYAEAVRYVDMGLKLLPDNSLMHAYRAVLNHERMEVKASIEDAVNAARGDNPNYGLQLLKDLDSPEEHLLALQIIDDTFTGLPDDYLLEARLLLAWGQPGEAESTLRKAINDGQAIQATYTDLADILAIYSSASEAYDVLGEGLRQYPDDGDLLMAQTEILSGIGAYDEALKIIDRLIENGIGDEDDLNRRKGEMLMNAGRYGRALPLLKKEMEAEANPDVLLSIGYAYRLIGDKYNSNDYFGKLLELTPEWMLENGFNPEFYSAVAHAGLGHNAEALAAVAPYDNAMLALVYILLGMEDVAIETLEPVVADDPNNYDFLYTFYLHPLHKNPKYREMLARHGVETTPDPETGLLRSRDFLNFKSEHGTPLEEVRNLPANDVGQWVREMNSKTPIDLGMMGQMTAVKLDEKAGKLSFFCTLSDDTNLFELLDKSPGFKQKQKDMMALVMVSKSPKLTQYPYTLEYNYTSADGKRTHTQTITPSDTKRYSEMAKSQEEVDALTLDFWTFMEPFGHDNITMTNNPDFVEMQLEIEGSHLELMQMRLMQADLRNMVESMLNDPSEISFTQAMARLGKGFKLIYYLPQIEESIEVVLTPQEIKSLIKE